MAELSFSNLNYVVESKERKTKKERRDDYHGKDYRRLITKLSKFEGKIDEMRSRNPERNSIFLKDIKWERALRRAKGEVIKDNMEGLKKGLKRKVKAKERRKIKWEERQEQVALGIERRQEKRKGNIEKRKRKK